MHKICREITDNFWLKNNRLYWIFDFDYGIILLLLSSRFADICRESGEGGAANGVELAGKVELLLLSLPLINDILSVTKELLSL